MMVDWVGAWHPLAERFPMLEEDALRELAASIAERGQFVACRLTPDGLGLDGRNRVAACALAGVVPVWEVYEGDPVAFIVDVNAERRHLTTGQRAMAVALGLVDAGRRTNGRFHRGSVPAANAGSLHYWRENVAQAGVVLDEADDLADRVLGGNLALDGAHKIAQERRQQRERIAALGGDLATLFEAGVIDLAEAERRVDEAARVERLPDDLAERVRGGTLSIDEAEAIKAENDRRLDAWAQSIRDALGVLGRMAGHPIPAGIRTRLTDSEGAQLEAALAAAKEVRS